MVRTKKMNKPTRPFVLVFLNRMNLYWTNDWIWSKFLGDEPSREWIWQSKHLWMLNSSSNNSLFNEVWIGCEALVEEIGHKLEATLEWELPMTTKLQSETGAHVLCIMHQSLGGFWEMYKILLFFQVLTTHLLGKWIGENLKDSTVTTRLLCFWLQ